MIAHCSFSTSDAIFPQELNDYGLNEELLAITFNQVKTGKKPIKWCLKGIPCADLYVKLHSF